MGDVIDLRVYAVDVKNGIIGPVSGSKYNSFLEGKGDIVLGLNNSVEMRENNFGRALKSLGLDAELLFLTTNGLVAATPDGLLNLGDMGICNDINGLYCAFDQYYQKRIEQGAHLHEKKAIRR